jgi:hypothetical protein
VEEQGIIFDFEKVGRSVSLRDDQFLFDYNVDHLIFEKGLPSGIFNKKYPGMGATYCEFMADRDSIIVFPFRSLAYEKYEDYEKKGRKTFFVGTDKNNVSTEIPQIREWYKKNKNQFPKFAVVADSIKKVVDALIAEGVDPYSKFTLVLDEVELLQMQSGFRKSLPLCFEYFKLFTSKCLVSATPLMFSDKDLKKLKIYDLEVYTSKIDEEGNNLTREKQSLQIERFKGHEPHVEIANKIARFFEKDWENNQKKKFFVGLNDIEGIKQMIEVFERYQTKASISVFTSSTSSDRILKIHSNGEIQDQILPSNINITTCINWSGIDIKEEVISIAISLNSKRHYSFSFENLVQFFGRCRVPQAEMPFIFAIGNDCELKTSKSKFSRNHRNSQLEKLLVYLEKSIDDDGDKNDLKEGLLHTGSAIYYEDINGNPKVNWLLEDLEKYEIGKVADYNMQAKGLIKKLKSRYLVVESKNEESFEVRPKEKTQDENLKEALNTFLDNLDADYPSSKLVERVLDFKRPNEIRVAAYWYLFGREFGLKEDLCKEMAVNYSGKFNPLFATRIILVGLRVYTWFRPVYEELIRRIYENRTNKLNITSKDLIALIESDKALMKHFSLLLNTLKEEAKSGRASVLLEHFFGLKKSTGTNKYFRIEKDVLEMPALLKAYPAIEEVLEKVAKLPPSKGLKYNSFYPVDLVSENFLKKS